MTKQEKKPQAQPKTKEAKNKEWICDLSITGYGFVLKGSPVLPKQLADFAKFNPEGDLSQYQK